MSDLDAIRARHVPNDPAPGYTGRVFCLADGQTWPCDTAIVLAALDAALAERDALVEDEQSAVERLDAAPARERVLREAADSLVRAWPNIINHPRLDNSEVAFLRAALAEAGS